MKTEQLIEMLSKNLEPVNPQNATPSLASAVVAGGAAAFWLMLNTVSLRGNLGARSSLAFLTLKLVFALLVVGIGLRFLSRAMHPGQDARKLLRLTLVPFVAVGIAAVGELGFGRSTLVPSITAGTDWVQCLSYIPVFSVVPWALLVWAVRRGAPTELTRTGAMTGLVAGAVGAAAYAFHCPDDSLPFIALWYGLSIAFCSAVGAVLGPRVLRW